MTWTPNLPLFSIQYTHTHRPGCSWWSDLVALWEEPFHQQMSPAHEAFMCKSTSRCSRSLQHPEAPCTFQGISGKFSSFTMLPWTKRSVLSGFTPCKNSGMKGEGKKKGKEEKKRKAERSTVQTPKGRSHLRSTAVNRYSATNSNRSRTVSWYTQVLYLCINYNSRPLM